MYVQVHGYLVRAERSVRRARPRFTAGAIAVAAAAGFLVGVAIARLA